MSISARTTLTAAALITSSDTAPKAPTSPLLSEEDSDTLLSAIGRMHGVVRNVGEALPSWEKCGSKDREAVVVRALRMLEEKARHERTVRHNSLRAKLSGVFATHMNAAREEKKAYDALPASLKSKLGTFPETVKVPVKEVVGCFGEGLTTEQVIHNLDNMSFKVGKAKEKGAPAYIILPFTAG